MSQARPPRQAAGAAALEEAVGLAFRVLKVAMVILVALFAVSGLRTIESHEVGFASRLGQLQDETVLEPGPTWGWPVIDELVVIDRRTKRYEVETFDLRRTKDEKLQGKAPVRDGGLDPTRDGYLLTGDANILHVTLAANVKVGEPAHRAHVLIGDKEQTREVIEVLLERAAVQSAAHRKVGSLLGTGKGDFLEEVGKILETSLRDGDLGLTVEGIDPERDVSPSPQVQVAFDRVAQNSQVVDRLRSNADSRATKRVSEAHLAAEQRVSDARSESDRIVATARADAERFTALLDEWKTQRRTLRERLLTDVLVRGAQETGEVFFVTDGELRIRIERDVSGLDEARQKQALEEKQ